MAEDQPASLPDNLNGLPEKPKQALGKIILSLENTILPEEKLKSTPSVEDGLDFENEVDLRILGCELIQVSGILLKLPQVGCATGQVLFHRFYYSMSFVRHSMEIVAMASVTLASKIEEAPRRIRDVINVFHHIKQVRMGKTPSPLILDQNYINLKNQVIKAERRLLKELGFCVHVKHPHKFIVTLLQVLECEKNQRLMQTAWNYMNDSLRTDVFVRFTPETIACACIYLSARVLRIPLPSQPAWYGMFGVTEKDIREVSILILKLYLRPKPDQEKLEQLVDKLKKQYENAKLIAKGMVPDNGRVINNNLSPNSTTNSPSVNKSKSTDTIEAKIPVKGQKNENDKTVDKVTPVKEKRAKSRSRSRSLSRGNSPPISTIKQLDDYDYEYEKNRRTPPRGYFNREHSRSRSKSKDRERRHRRKHKRDYSRSRSRSPQRYHHRDQYQRHHHNSTVKKSRRSDRSREYYDRDNHFSKIRRNSRSPRR